MLHDLRVAASRAKCRVIAKLPACRGPRFVWIVDADWADYDRDATGASDFSLPAPKVKSLVLSRQGGDPASFPFTEEPHAPIMARIRALAALPPFCFPPRSPRPLSRRWLGPSRPGRCFDRSNSMHHPHVPHVQPEYSPRWSMPTARKAST
jgi:hypothetical protein